MCCEVEAPSCTTESCPVGTLQNPDDAIQGIELLALTRSQEALQERVAKQTDPPGPCCLTSLITYHSFGQQCVHLARTQRLPHMMVSMQLGLRDTDNQRTTAQFKHNVPNNSASTITCHLDPACPQPYCTRTPAKTVCCTMPHHWHTQNQGSNNRVVAAASRSRAV